MKIIDLVWPSHFKQNLDTPGRFLCRWMAAITSLRMTITLVVLHALDLAGKQLNLKRGPHSLVNVEAMNTPFGIAHSQGVTN